MKLFPHQISAIDFLKDKQRFLLADDQGLGKTATAIHVAIEKQAKNILVLCPKSLVLNWIKEIGVWYLNTDTATFDKKGLVISLNSWMNTERSFEAWKIEPYRPCFFVTNWDSLIVKSRLDYLLSKQWDMVIGDESHVGIKNWTAKRCKTFVFDVCKNVPNILLMTGTPITRSASDLHPTLSLLQPGVWGKYEAFCEKYCQRTYHGFGRKGYSYTGFKNEAELNQKLSLVMLRRLKKDVLKDLPDKMYKYVPLSVDISAMSTVLKNDAAMLQHYIHNDLQIPGHLMHILHAIGIAKVRAAAEYISNLGVPTVVFAQHKDVIFELEMLLKKEGLSVGVIQGETSASGRQEIVDTFQAGSLDVVIGNLIAASTGITLTHSSNVVFCEFPWSPSTLNQAEDRCHRIGQHNSVLVHYLIADNSLDAVVLDSLHNKRVGIDRIIEEEERV